MTASEAISELQRIGRAFSALASLEQIVEVAATAESRQKAVVAEFATSRKAVEDANAAAAKAVADATARAAEIVKGADDHAAAVQSEVAALKAKHADEIKKAKDKLEDIKEATDTAVKTYESKNAAAEKKLADTEAAIVVAEKKLADINAAIAAIAGR